VLCHRTDSAFLSNNRTAHFSLYNLILSYNSYLILFTAPNFSSPSELFCDPNLFLLCASCKKGKINTVPTCAFVTSNQF